MLRSSSELLDTAPPPPSEQRGKAPSGFSFTTLPDSGRSGSTGIRLNATYDVFDSGEGELPPRRTSAGMADSTHVRGSGRGRGYGAYPPRKPVASQRLSRQSLDSERYRPLETPAEDLLQLDAKDGGDGGVERPARANEGDEKGEEVQKRDTTGGDNVVKRHSKKKKVREKGEGSAEGKRQKKVRKALRRQAKEKKAQEEQKDVKDEDNPVIGGDHRKESKTGPLPLQTSLGLTTPTSSSAASTDGDMPLEEEELHEKEEEQAMAPSSSISRSAKPGSPVVTVKRVPYAPLPDAVPTRSPEASPQREGRSEGGGNNAPTRSSPQGIKEEKRKKKKEKKDEEKELEAALGGTSKGIDPHLLKEVNEEKDERLQDQKGSGRGNMTAVLVSDIEPIAGAKAKHTRRGKRRLKKDRPPLSSQERKERKERRRRLKEARKGAGGAEKPGEDVAESPPPKHHNEHHQISAMNDSTAPSPTTTTTNPRCGENSDGVREVEPERLLLQAPPRVAPSEEEPSPPPDTTRLHPHPPGHAATRTVSRPTSSASPVVKEAGSEQHKPDLSPSVSPQRPHTPRSPQPDELKERPLPPFRPLSTDAVDIQKKSKEKSSNRHHKGKEDALEKRGNSSPTLRERDGGANSGRRSVGLARGSAAAAARALQQTRAFHHHSMVMEATMESRNSWEDFSFVHHTAERSSLSGSVEVSVHQKRSQTPTRPNSRRLHDDSEERSDAYTPTMSSRRESDVPYSFPPSSSASYTFSRWSSRSGPSYSDASYSSTSEYTSSSSSSAYRDVVPNEIPLKEGCTTPVPLRFFLDVEFRLQQFQNLLPYAEEAVINEWDLVKGQWTRMDTRVVLSVEPFAHGNMRSSYHFIDFSKPNCRLAAKRYLKSSVTRDQYFDDVSMHSVSGHWARLYNFMNPPKPVKFVPAAVLELPHRRPPLILAMEPLLEGTFRKYNNNCGYLPENVRWTPQAFSHFTYVYSRKELIVVDIQGVNDIYTDPQILSPDGEGYGRGNLGHRGIKRFFKTHVCNPICHQMGLAERSSTRRRRGVRQGQQPMNHDYARAILSENLPPKMRSQGGGSHLTPSNSNSSPKLTRRGLHYSSSSSRSSRSSSLNTSVSTEKPPPLSPGVVSKTPFTATPLGVGILSGAPANNTPLLFQSSLSPVSTTGSTPQFNYVQRLRENLAKSRQTGGSNLSRSSSFNKINLNSSSDDAPSLLLHSGRIGGGNSGRHTPSQVSSYHSGVATPSRRFAEPMMAIEVVLPVANLSSSNSNGDVNSHGRGGYSKK